MATIGRYEIYELIGEGGFGRVYEGLDVALNRKVAIKVCTIQQDGYRRRFLREAELAAGLRHANIVTVYDFGEADGRPYLVQEYLTGEDLDAIIDRRDLLPIDMKIALLIQIATGLAYAHSMGIVHRDVKPSNMRLQSDGQIRIMDFGIAKALDDDLHLTQTGAAIGTAAYLAPEQFRGEPLDHRADIFSFGVLAYELLTYCRPFRGDSISALYYQIAHEEPDPIEPISPTCPPGLAAVVMRCLRKLPDERFPDCGAIIVALAGVLESGVLDSGVQTLGGEAATASDPFALSIIAPVPVISADAPTVAVETAASRFRIAHVAAYGGVTTVALSALLWTGLRKNVPVVGAPHPPPSGAAKESTSSPAAPNLVVPTSRSSAGSESLQSGRSSATAPVPGATSVARVTHRAPGEVAATGGTAGPTRAEGSGQSATIGPSTGNTAAIALFIRGGTPGDAVENSDIARSADVHIKEYLSTHKLHVVVVADDVHDAPARRLTDVTGFTDLGKGAGATLVIVGAVSVAPQGEILGMKSALCTLALKAYDVASRRLVAEALEHAPGPGASIEMATDRALIDCVRKASDALIAQLGGNR